MCMCVQADAIVATQHDTRFGALGLQQHSNHVYLDITSLKIHQAPIGSVQPVTECIGNH
jgi:hypothetical protein